MLHGFFKQSLNKLRKHQTLLEKTAFTLTTGTSLCFYPEFIKHYTHNQISMFYHQLTTEEKTLIEKNNFIKKEMIEKADSQIPYMLGYPN